MSRDSQRYRKTYSYYRVQPRTELLEVIVDESLDWKKSVRAASTTSHSLTGAGSSISIGGVTIVDEDRVLLKDQSPASQNGIYYFEVTDGNYSLTRSSDSKSGTLSCGAATYVEEGTNAGKIYILTTTNPIDVESTSLTWGEFSSGGGGGGLGGSGTTGYVSKFTGTSTLGNSSIFDDGTNVGIGTTSYTSRLFVSGSSTASSPTLTVKEGQPTSFGTPILEVQNSLGTSLLYVTGNLGTVGGRIGIGTNRPDAKLHVSSSYGGSSHGISIGQPNFLGFASNTYTSRQHTFYGGDGTSKRLLIDDNGNVILGGELPGLTTNTARLLVTGSSTSTDVVFAIKAGVPSPILSAQKPNGAEVLWISSSSGNNAVGSDVFMWISGSRTDNNTGADKVVFGGDVRISGSLSVGTGSIFVTANDIQFGSSGTRIEKNSNDMKFFDLNNTSGKTLTEISAVSPVYFTSDVSGVIYTTGSVGIGKTSPTKKLHVSGSSSDAFQIDNDNGNWNRIYLYKPERAWSIGQDNGQAFVIGDESAGLYRVYIDNSGNVGIGSTTSPAARLQVSGSSTASAATTLIKAGVPSPTGPLLDIQDYAGNSIVFVSGSGLSGSLTKLTDGTSYLRAGTNITISTGSNGAVTIEASGGSGPTGSGTDGYLAQWSGGTTVLGDSFVRNFNSDIAKYMKKEHWFEDSAGGSYVYIKSNSTDTGRIGINVNPSFALDIIAGANSINEAVRVRNNNAAQGTGLRQTFIAGNYSEPTFRITHAWPSNAEGHYTFFGITKPTPSAGTPSIAERLKLYSSGSVEVSGSLVARLDPEIINKPVLSAQKANGTEVMWVSSSAGTNTVGTDVFMWVSGSRTTDNTGADKVVFGGDVRISGSLSVGTGSVLLTSNDVQFGSSGMRIQKSGNDMKFFDINNSGGLTLSELAAGGGGSSPTYWTSSTNGQVYATGSVGIGTTSPTDRLSVHSGGQDRVGANISSAVSSLYMGSNVSAEGVTSIEYDRSAGKLHFKYGSTGSPLSAAVSIKTTDGNVGIGTTTISARFHVSTSSDEVSRFQSSGSPYISLYSGEARQGYFYSDGSAVQVVSEASKPLWLRSASSLALQVNSSTSTSMFLIDTSGNVGIGTSTISAKLHVSGSSTGNTPTILARHGIANGSSLPVLNVQNSSGDSLLWVSGSGYVGIGTSGASAVTNTLKGLGGNVVSIHGAFASSLLFEIDGNLSGAINNSNSGMVVVPGANRSLGLGSDNSVKMVVETDGDVNIQTSNRYFDASISSGQGIRLRSSPGNSDAQVLDCYNESSITVTLAPETGTLSLDSAYETLEVTRIGRTVNICGTLVCDGGLGQSGHLQIDVDGALSGMLPMVDTAVAVYLDDWSGDWVTAFGHPQAYISSTNGNIHISRLADGNAEPIATYCVTSSVIKVMVTYVAVV